MRIHLMETQAPVRLAAVVMLTASLSACGTRTVSDINRDGTANSQLTWPSPNAAVWRPVKPNPANLSRLAPGMGKTQLYALLGVPHFREGFAGVREWDYVFDLSSQAGPDRCQFKVLFDQEMKSQGFIWRKRDCSLKERVTSQPAQNDHQVASSPQPFATLSTDVLFNFNESSLTIQGETSLLPLVNDIRRQIAEIRPEQRLKIQVAGHSDHLGSRTHNMELSLRRAKTVAGYLARIGLFNASVEVASYGEDLPIVHCSDSLVAEQIRCLAPNRRVEVLISVEPVST